MDFNENQFARMIEHVGVDDTPRPEHQQQLRKRALAVFDRAAAPPSHVLSHQHSIPWRKIMRHPISRVTAATIFIFALGGVALWFSAGGTQAAFADFVESIITAKNAKFKQTFEAEGKAPEISQSMFLAPNRLRSEMPSGKVVIFNGAKQKMVFLDPKEKRASITDLAGAPKDKISRNMFTELQKHLLEVRYDSEVKRESLGEKEIDGRRAIGYRIVMPGQTIILWGDPKTALPIRVEKTWAANPKAKTTMTDFAFNVDVDESLFSVEPPAGYTVFRSRLDASLPGENDLIESLRSYSELFGGAFPNSLAVNDELGNSIMEKIFQKKGWKISNKLELSQEQRQELMDILSKTTRGFGFALEMLPLNADAHYAGKGVSFGATETPIFWYRPKDQKKYRVIYADLSVQQSDTPPNVPDAQPVPAKPGPDSSAWKSSKVPSPPGRGLG